MSPSRGMQSSRPSSGIQSGRSGMSARPQSFGPQASARPQGMRSAGPQSNGRFGHIVRQLPKNHVKKTYFGITYFIVDNIYYRALGNLYYICRPPYGVIYYPYDDFFWTAVHFGYFWDVLYTYRTINENAQIITEQNETIAENNALIASQNEALALNADRAKSSAALADKLGLVQSFASVDTEYFYEDGVFFVADEDGQYKTIVPPAGALVEQLPEDYQVVELDGDEYYLVDDTVYRTVVYSGKVYFEVLGQMTGTLLQQYVTA